MGGVGVLVAGVGVLVTKKPADLLRNLRPGFLVILRLLHIKGILSNHFLIFGRWFKKPRNKKLKLGKKISKLHFS